MADRFQKSRTLSAPEPGFFVMRLVKGGPLVPAVILRPCPWVQPEPGLDPFEWCRPYDRSTRLAAYIGLEFADPDQVWPFGQPISAAEYADRLAMLAYAVAREPDSPHATPRRPVDISQLPPPGFPNV